MGTLLALRQSHKQSLVRYICRCFDAFESRKSCSALKGRVLLSALLKGRGQKLRFTKIEQGLFPKKTCGLWIEEDVMRSAVDKFYCFCSKKQQNLSVTQDFPSLSPALSLLISSS